MSQVLCDTTSAAKHGLAQVKFDEVYCISPDYIDRFKTGEYHIFGLITIVLLNLYFVRQGEFDWYAVLSKRFEKKI
jgi:hypothetical protein